MPAQGKSSRFGLGAERKLSNRAQFEQLLHRGVRRSVAGFTFFISKRGAGSARLGILISRKHASRAIDRNRIKRCIREAFRLEQEGLAALDLLVRPPYGQKASRAMSDRLRAALAGLNR